MPDEQPTSVPNGERSVEGQPAGARLPADPPIPLEAEEAIKGVGLMIAGATLIAKALAGVAAAGIAVWHFFSPHSTGH